MYCKGLNTKYLFHCNLCWWVIVVFCTVILKSISCISQSGLGCTRMYVRIAMRHFVFFFLVQRTQQGIFCVFVCFHQQIQGSIRPHAIIILPNSAGTEVLVCYEDEGVYIDTYGRITKDTVLQWGEMPASVGKFQPV